MRLGLPRGIFPVDLPVTSSKVLLSSSILASYPANINLIDLIILNIMQILVNSPLSSLLGPKTRLMILFSNNHSLYSSINLRDHIPYSTIGNIIILCILFLQFFERSRENKSVRIE